MKHTLLVVTLAIGCALAGCNRSKPSSIENNAFEVKNISPIDSLKQVTNNLSFFDISLGSHKDSIEKAKERGLWNLNYFEGSQPCIFANLELPITLSPKARLCFLLYNDSIAEISISFSEDSALDYFTESFENKYGKESSYLNEYKWRTWEFANQEIAIEKHNESVFGGKYTICMRDKSLKQKWIIRSKQGDILSDERKKEIQKDKDAINNML